MNLRTAGSSTARSADTLDRRRRSLAPLVIVTVAALVFAILLVLVRLQWAPLESADHGAAADINSLIAGNATLVAVVKAVTWLGSGGVLWTVIGAATVILAAGGDGCSSSRRSPCPYSSPFPVCTGASTTRPISSPASCFPRSG